MYHPTRNHQGKQGGMFGHLSLEGVVGSGCYDTKATDDQVSWGIFQGILGVVTVSPTVWYHKVPKAINESLNNWLHNQHTLIGDYKKMKAGTKFWDNKEDRYVKILNALGVDYQART